MILDGVPAPPKGAQQPPLFGPCVLWPRSPISATALYMKYLGNRRTDLQQINKKDVLSPSLGRVRRSRPISAACLRLCLEKYLCSSVHWFLQRAQLHCKRCISYSDSVCLSVCLSVRLSHAGIVSKRRHVARCSFHCWIAKCV